MPVGRRAQRWGLLPAEWGAEGGPSCRPRSLAAAPRQPWALLSSAQQTDSEDLELELEPASGHVTEKGLSPNTPASPPRLGAGAKATSQLDLRQPAGLP